ncbi:MAG: phenylalanine--tRNA ligase subunit alpha [Planctomycetes bacterium]|nr:phenylalanine--tRNA ligase subunit alpha [Planctomycetota bacterium]
MELFEELESVKKQALTEIDSAGDAEVLQQLEIKYLGRKGLLRDLFTQLGSVPAEKKSAAGQSINQLKQLLEEKVTGKKETLGTPVKVATGEQFDTSLPGEKKTVGHFHPVYQTMTDLSNIFVRLGFDIARGPEIENEFNNFDALNIPADHPARDAWDTFYLHNISGSQRHLLRCHTSPVQIRVMKKTKPPLRIIAPGKVFRSDTPDPGHFPMFHQIEGLMVGEDVSFAHLKGVLNLFIKEFFGPETKMRFRPSFFSFTEPSAEVDISCVICNGKGTGCSVCRGEGWMEILGCGMVDPNVFKTVNYDPEKYTGFAFGLGVERMAMIKYRINDIRLFTENHLKFLNQF